MTVFSANFGQSHTAQGPLRDAKHANVFMYAGNARVTAVSDKTGQRFTYRVRSVEDKPGRFFVSLLTGPSNEDDFSYLGMIDAGSFRLTKASKQSLNAPSVKAIMHVVGWLSRDTMPPGTTLWHEGRCGRCGRTLTDPESILLGLGPECRQHIGV